MPRRQLVSRLDRFLEQDWYTTFDELDSRSWTWTLGFMCAYFWLFELKYLTSDIFEGLDLFWYLPIYDCLSVNFWSLTEWVQWEPTKNFAFEDVFTCIFEFLVNPCGWSCSPLRYRFEGQGQASMHSVVVLSFGFR